MKKLGVLGAVAMALCLTMACGAEPSAAGDDDIEGDDDPVEEVAGGSSETTASTSEALTRYCTGSCKRLRCWPRPTTRRKTAQGCVFVRCGATVCG